MSDPFFFGYGSLVNRRTHDFPDTHAARVTGWRRAWRHTPLRALSFLTVVPAADDFVEGLIAAVPGADWAALDERERAYDRHDVSHRVRHVAGRDLEVAIYAIPEGFHRAPTEDNPVLLSYIDTVVQGFLTEFGPAGVAHFFETTEGWDVPILNDRAAPVYARAQPTTARERDIVDDSLGRLSATIRPMD